MAVTNGWGQGVENNTIEWGKGKDNATNDWGKIYDTSASGDTLLEVATVAFSNTKSVDFDGVDDFVEFSDLTSSGVFTLSFWIKPTEFNTNNGSFVMGTKANSSNLIKLISATQIVFKPGNSSSTLTESTNIMVLNQWQHLMFIRDSSNNVTAYRNGSTFGSPVTKTQTLTINCIGLIANFFRYKGQIDELAFFTTDQTANVSSIYNSGTPLSLSSYSPVAWYRMGDGDTFPTLTDNGSGGNNGTMTNMVSGDIVADVPPNFNMYSLNFDGVDDFVAIGNPTELQITGDMTVSAWIKTSSNTSQAIFAKNDGTNNSYLFYLSAGKPAMVIWTTDSSTFNQTVSGSTIGDGNWHNLMWVKVGSNFKIYLDGSLLINQSKSATMNNSSGNVSMGGRMDLSSPLTTNGNLDEVAVWNSDQSSNVTTIYNSGKPNDITSLSPIAWWRFEEGSGTTATDSGSGGNDGTITNGATYSTDKP